MLPWMPASVRSRLSTLSRRRTSVAHETSIESSRPVIALHADLVGRNRELVVRAAEQLTSEAAVERQRAQLAQAASARLGVAAQIGAQELLASWSSARSTPAWSRVAMNTSPRPPSGPAIP
jgi:hypothetical protein